MGSIVGLSIIVNSYCKGCLRLLRLFLINENWRLLECKVYVVEIVRVY